jgi:hypothetical protein
MQSTNALAAERTAMCGTYVELTAPSRSTRAEIQKSTAYCMCCLRYAGVITVPEVPAKDIYLALGAGGGGASGNEPSACLITSHSSQ